jgi:hypothetical protein
MVITSSSTQMHSAQGLLAALAMPIANSFTVRGISNFDISLMKRTNITESKAFEIRAEFFNVFNHAQFNNPDGDLNGTWEL